MAQYFFQRFIISTQIIFVITCYIDFHLLHTKHSKIVIPDIINVFFTFSPLHTCLYYIYYVGFTVVLSLTAGIQDNTNTMNVLLYPS